MFFGFQAPAHLEETQLEKGDHCTCVLPLPGAAQMPDENGTRKEKEEAAAVVAEPH